MGLLQWKFDLKNLCKSGIPWVLSLGLLIRLVMKYIEMCFVCNCCSQARVLTNLEHLNVEETDVGTGSSVPMPELQHNMKLLVDMTEAEIRRLDTNLRQKEDTAVCTPKFRFGINAPGGLWPGVPFFPVQQCFSWFLIYSGHAGS